MLKVNNLLVSSLLSAFLFLANPQMLLSQNDTDAPFRVSLAARYLNRFMAYGLDLAGESPALRASANLTHQSGIYVDGYFTQPTDSELKNSRQGSFDLGYETTLGESVSLYAEYAYYLYENDSVNALSPYTHSLSLNASIDLDIIELGFSYDRFLGIDAASYFSIDVSTFREVGPLYVMPLIQMVFVSQTVEDRFLQGGKGKKSEGTEIVTSTTMTGLSNSSVVLVMVYPVTPNLSLSLVPSIIFYHQDDLSAESSRFLWNAGLRYGFDL